MNNRKREIIVVLGFCVLLAGCGKKNGVADQVPIYIETTAETTIESTTDSTADLGVESTSYSTTDAKEDDGTKTNAAKDIHYRQDLLPYITIKDGFTIADYGESAGTDYSYAVFRLCQEGKSDYDMEMYWEILVMDGEDVLTVLQIENEEYGSAFPPPSEIVLEHDVNFDGINDILLCLGHFGNQGFISYKCFLAAGDGTTFTHCPSFAGIANPAIDNEAKVVRSQWRNWAASHSWGIFTFQDNEFTMAEFLTESLELDENDDEVWTWRDEIWKDDRWQVREEYTELDYDSETLYQKHYGPDSYWGLDQDKWNTLFNGGKMSDYSIYAD